VDARLAFALELEQRDEAVAELLGALADAATAVAELRAGAEAVLAFRAAQPSERTHLDEAAAEAAAALERTRAELAAARIAVERARREEAREAARADEARAEATVRSAEERRERIAARRTALEQESEQREAEAAELERRAPDVAARLDALPRISHPAPPGRGVEAVVEWAASAEAALLVARGGLESERERVVREANELASSVLEEPLHSTSVALVRRELEERLG
jgi:chromosome segregation ATPase